MHITNNNSNNDDNLLMVTITLIIENGRKNTRNDELHSQLHG